MEKRSRSGLQGKKKTKKKKREKGVDGMGNGHKRAKT